jgi:hypothetical protein
VPGLTSPAEGPSGGLTPKMTGAGNVSIAKHKESPAIGGSGASDETRSAQRSPTLASGASDYRRTCTGVNTTPMTWRLDAVEALRLQGKGARRGERLFVPSSEFGRMGKIKGPLSSGVPYP